MTRSKFFLCFLLLLWTLTDSFSQRTGPGLYVVITFEDVYKISQHGKRDYFWIISNDSLKSFESKLSKLFMSDFTKNNLDDCCGEKPIDPFVLTEGSIFIFDAGYSKELENLKQIVFKNRKRLQRISKKWDAGQEETITVFATPMYGRFCSSEYYLSGQTRTGYKGRVFLPFSSFTYADDFWKTANAKFILNRDFSRLNFEMIP
jgi:hypothetical protein